MKYKFLVLICLSLVFLTGCNSKQEDKVLTCKFSTTSITLTISDGKIVKYVDEIQGEFSKEKIEQLNREYLQNIKDNKEAYIIMRGVIASSGGDCN